MGLSHDTGEQVLTNVIPLTSDMKSANTRYLAVRPPIDSSLKLLSSVQIRGCSCPRGNV